MLKTYRDSGNLELLASYDFLDQCLLGETGIGKTYTAKLIHELGPRASRPLISVNCAELRPLLSSQNCFGHEKGLEMIETELLNTALENHNHNRTRAARSWHQSFGSSKKLKRLGH